MAFVAGLEAHLRMISTEATRKYPIVKDAAERAMFKVRLLSSTSDVAGCDDILKTYLLACELKNTKLSILGLVGMEKLIAHDAVLPSALPSILATLKEHSHMSDEIVQLKTLQTALTILQSQLHPTDEDQMSIILGLCLRLLGNSRNPDSVWSTAVATLRQGISLIFNRVLSAEDLPTKKLYGGTSSWASSFRSVAGEVSHSISASNLAEIFGAETGLAAQARNEPLSEAGRLGVRLFEDLTSLAGGGRQEAQDNERSSVDHGAVLEALEHALKATEAAFLEMADRLLHENPELMLLGSCVLVMLMKDEDIYIMDVGDSRAVVAQQHSKSWGSLSHVGHARTECAKVYGQNQVQTR